jgi:serine protease
MKLLRSMLFTAAVAALLPLPLGSAYAVNEVSVAAPEGARLIVRFKADAPSLRAHALSAKASAGDTASAVQSRAQGLGQRLGVSLAGGRALDERTQVVAAGGQSPEALRQRLSQDAEVEWVAVDQLRKHYATTPNDPLFTAGPVPAGPAVGQWYLKAPGGAVVSSINAVNAWDRTTGSTNIVVAVLDTGVRPDHPDLAGKLLAGYDMVSQAVIANDGDDRDADSSDPGDWVTAEEANSPGTFHACTTLDKSTGKYLKEDSSWHGTQVSGLIGAASNNGIGMAGVAWGSKLLPVRVLGKCGGYDSDIVAGMRWAAGLAVPGVPANPTPARVLNMSLGGEGSCTGSATATLYREAITAINAQGAVIVVAAGNSEGHAINLPANCPGVVGVVALRHIGTKVGFSDLGPEVTIAAPGGNCVNESGPCLYPMLSTINSGTTGPATGGSTYTDSLRAAVGTSFSAPLVSGAVALMLSQQPNLSSAEVISALKRSARAFPTTGAGNNADGTPVKQCAAPSAAVQDECYCTTSTCGAGMLDAAAALAAVSGVFARVDYAPAAPKAGEAIQLSAAGSLIGPGRSIKSYSWSLVNGGGIVSAFSSSTNASTATLPATSAAGTITVRLQITDDTDASSSANTTITVVAPEPPAVAAASNGGGGGGAMSWAWLLGLLLASGALALNARRARVKATSTQP